MNQHNQVNMNNHFYIFIKIVVVWSLGVINLIAQDDRTTETDREKIKSLMGMGVTKQTSTTSPITQYPNSLIMAVDEEKYFVDAGDVFIVKIDVKGPAFKLFNSIVTPDGYLVLPEAPSIFVQHLVLKEAKQKIDSVLKMTFPDAQSESYLYQVHSINVNVLGCIPKAGKYQVLSNNRLFDAIDLALSAGQTDSTVNFNWKKISFRNISLQRGDQKQSYDLLRYKLLGETRQNPYLMENDLIYVNYKDTLHNNISIEGAVAQPLIYEYQGGDRLIEALCFAGGLLPSADSMRIEVHRFSPDGTHVGDQILRFPVDSSFYLRADDRIYARYKFNYNEKYMVEIRGEVKYPGLYAINEGKTRLTEMIEKAGGFSPRALIKNAKLLRFKDVFEDKELYRLSRMMADEMNDIELSYFRLRSREDVRLVSCDFEKLFILKKTSEDVLLRDQDLIIIPSVRNTILVSGGVIAPGNVLFETQRNYLDYIILAGGFNERAREGSVKVIKTKSGAWLDADEKVIIEEGDVIFIPEWEEIDWYDVFREGLTIVSQVATVVLIVINLK